MKATLYKLKEGLVLCSDEAIKEDELHINLATLEVENASKNLSVNILSQNSFGDSVRSQYKKVLTQSPILSSLSPDKQKEIGWFDVEKLAKLAFKDKFKKSPIIMGSMEADSAWLNTWANGFQKHAELTADRRFTEGDLLKAISLAKVAKTSDGLINMDNWISDGYEGAESAYSSKEIIQSLSKPKSWEVEYEESNNLYKVTKIIKQQP